MKRFTKLFQTRASSVDETKKTIRFKISDNKPDRMGEIVDQESWQTDEYMKNPIVLWGHNPDEPENVLGTTLSLDVQKDATYAEMQFDDDINPKAGLVWKQLLKGTLNSVSVGFINHTFVQNFSDDDDASEEDSHPILKDNELLEISIVPIPANPRAIALAVKDGSISTKDAKWLRDSMSKELEAIEEQLKSNEGDKNMTEEQAKTLIASVEALSTKVADMQTSYETKFNELSTSIQALQPAEETEEEKKVREEQEAADKAAADAQAAEDAKKDPAKGGGDPDQPGAGDEELDENAELTPDQEAELDAQLAEELEALEPAA